MKNRYLTVSITALFLSLSPFASAQETATVTGTVTDATGALIPGAEVTAINDNIGISSTRISGETGAYSIPALQPGPYTITTSLPGFSDSSIEVRLTPNQTFRFNFEMQVGAVATAVEVVSDADALLATTGASVGDALPENEIISLPLATRNIFDLLATTAGMVRSSNGDAQNFAGMRNSAVNATRDGVPVTDGRYLDWNGAFSATYSSPDLIEEVQITVGTIDAAASRGNAQVRLQTRSGTNQFHGALFYTTNNSAANANDWFSNLRGQGKDWENRQQFGGRIGGPIVRNKAFFFLLIDEQRYRTRENVIGPVWTQEARAGLFRYFPGAENQNFLAGPGTRSVDAAGNPVQPTNATGGLQSFNLFSDVNDPFRTAVTQNAFMQETFSRMPLPNDFTTGDGLNTAGHNWVRSRSGVDNAAGTSQNVNRDNLNFRIDYQVTDNNSVNLVMSREHNFNSDAAPQWPGGLEGAQVRDPRIYTASWTSTISSSVLNAFRFGFRETNWNGRTAFEVGCCNDPSKGLLDDLDSLTPEAKQAFDDFIPQTASGYLYRPPISQSLGDRLWMRTNTGTRGSSSPLYHASDEVSWVFGSHSLKAGWEGNWAHSNGFSQGGTWPQVFLGSGNFPVAIAGNFPGLDNADADTAEAILNDLSGSVDEVTQRFGVTDSISGSFADLLETNRLNTESHQNDWSVFLKDDWNVTQNLTLNWGVRLDVYGVPYEANGLLTLPVDGNFAGLSGASGQLTELIPTGRNSPNPDIQAYDKNWDNIGPSLGFSYRVPWVDRTVVIRGGYGISYPGAPTFLDLRDPSRNPGRLFTAADTPVVYTTVEGSVGGTDVVLPLPVTVQPFETVPVTDRNQTLSLWAPDRRVPNIQNFNFRIQAEVAPNTTLEVGWLGTKGTSLWGGRQLNEPNILAALNGETFLDAFNTTRGGGDSPMFNTMLNGIRLGSGACGPVDGVTCTGSDALRQWRTSDDYLADGEVGRLAEELNRSNRGTGVRGGLLRTNGFPENFLVLNPQFRRVRYFDNGDASTYHALQAKISKRLSSGFSGQFSYTWSKAIGDSGTNTNRFQEDKSFNTRDPNNIALQKGLVPFHRTHLFNAHGTWSLPFGPGRLLGSGAPSWAHRLIEDWQLSSIFSWNSGQPISVSTPIETLSAIDDRNTPDLIGAFPKSLGQVNVGDGVVTYLDGFSRVRSNTSVFYGSDLDGLSKHDDLWEIQDASGNTVLQNPSPGTTGNLSTNWLEGPAQLKLDVSLSKTVQIRESTSFTIRADAINLLNTPLWGNPNLNINSGSFGRITSASGSRTFTLNARIDF
jgi:hypothetical protein